MLHSLKTFKWVFQLWQIKTRVTPHLTPPKICLFKYEVSESQVSFPIILINETSVSANLVCLWCKKIAVDCWN